MNAGDLLVVHCWYGLIPYSHYAIALGDGSVIQLASDPDRPNRTLPDLKTMCVRHSSLAAFADGRPVHIIEVENSLTVVEVLERAKSKLGLSAYCLVSGNCEHFARWCKTGYWVSEQVDETRQSLTRTAVHTAVLVTRHLGNIRSATPLRATTQLASNARLAIPSIAGEISEQVAKCSLKRLNAAPHIVERGGAIASYGTVAVLGLIFGGATGSVSAIAAHSWARVSSRAKLSS